MIRILKGAELGSANDVLKEFFEARRRALREAGWFSRPGQSVSLSDAFDDDEARYVIVYDGSRLIGGARLRPAGAAPAGEELFPGLNRNALTLSTDTGEMSQLFLDERYARRKGAFIELMAGAARCAASMGCGSLFALAEMRHVQTMLALELAVQVLHEPQVCGALALAPVKIRANMTVAAQLTEIMGKARGPSLPIREKTGPARSGLRRPETRSSV